MSQEALEAATDLKAMPRTQGVNDLYNGMIHPLIPFAIRGAIWYQGESNADRAWDYRKLFPDLIANWRTDWKQGDFPFLFVQLAPFKSNDPTNSQWAELRDAQLHTMLTLPNTAMAVITDVGDEKDIHPKRKQPVGERLATAALALSYGEKIEYSGPIFDRLTFDADRAIVHFTHVGKGLELRGDKLTGFTIAGDDRQFFYNADAKIEGDTVIVTSPKVAQARSRAFRLGQLPGRQSLEQRRPPRLAIPQRRFPADNTGNGTGKIDYASDANDRRGGRDAAVANRLSVCRWI